jgi:GTP-binding protein
VCFIGRSNVGKSSLINALANQRIAKTSNTPGRTQLINFFDAKGKIVVDLPGYGYARMSKTQMSEVSEMINDYLINRNQIACVFVLIDAKIGPLINDQDMINFLMKNEIEFYIILTKFDKATQSEMFKTRQKLNSFTKNYLITSVKTKKNINNLTTIINNFI